MGLGCKWVARDLNLFKRRVTELVEHLPHNILRCALAHNLNSVSLSDHTGSRIPLSVLIGMMMSTRAHAQAVAARSGCQCRLQLQMNTMIIMMQLQVREASHVSGRDPRAVHNGTQSSTHSATQL